MIIPRFLEKGDAVGVTAPSAGVTESTDRLRFAHARSYMERRGYRVVETPDVYTCDEDGRSAPAGQRVRELGAVVGDPDVAAVYAASGGDYEFEMLPLMDWRLIEDNPKWIQGYSDNTVLLFKATAEHDIATAYGGNFGDFGMEPLHPSVVQGLEFLEGARTSQRSFRRHASGFADRVTGLEPFPEDSVTEWTSTKGDVSFGGRLIGGCMDVIEWFLRNGAADASGFAERYSGEGIVWYLETFDMDAARVRDTLSAMISRGWTKGCTGVVFGRPLFYSGPEGYEDAAMSVLGGLDVPVLFGADVGHKAPRMAFVNGAVAEFDFRGGECGLSYDFGVDGRARWQCASRPDISSCSGQHELPQVLHREWRDGVLRMAHERNVHQRDHAIHKQPIGAVHGIDVGRVLDFHL